MLNLAAQNYLKWSAFRICGCLRIFASVLRVIWGVANQLQETGSHLFCQKRVGVLIYKHQLCQLNDVMIRLTNAHTPSHSKVSNGTLAGSQINPADAKPRERFEGLLNRTVRITCNFQYKMLFRTLLITQFWWKKWLQNLLNFDKSL